MNRYEFRFMHRGEQLDYPSAADESLLRAVQIQRPGKQRALLMLHGFSSSPAVYRRLIPLLPDYQAIVCPILPGHADSIAAFGQAQASDWLKTAEMHCQQLMLSYQQVDVLGLSLGGLLASQLAQKYSLNHLFLLAPALRLHAPPKQTLKALDWLTWLGFIELRNKAGNLLDPAARELSYRRVPLSAFITVLEMLRDYDWQAPACPTDVFLGLHDEVVDSQAVDQLLRGHSGIEIHWLTESAHVLPLDNEFQLIADCIQQRFQR